jgi:hypothetical protein
MSNIRFSTTLEESGNTLVFVGEIALTTQSAFAHIDVTDTKNFKVVFRLAGGDVLSIPIKSLETQYVEQASAIAKVAHVYKSNLAHLRSEGVEFLAYEKAFVADYYVSLAYQKHLRQMLVAP